VRKGLSANADLKSQIADIKLQNDRAEMKRRRRQKQEPRRGIDAYLDIETTGLDPYLSSLTVVGVCRDEGNFLNMIQLVGEENTPENMRELLEGVETVYTYNGGRFDLPFIKTRLGVDVLELCRHNDLMHECHRQNLRGGFKSVERQLGISRETEGVNGSTAIDLWFSFVQNGDREALELLLEYNREDVLNLRALRRKLGV
jgi:uncharacterized protein YprB with RNaseH-like and TPR domain